MELDSFAGVSSVNVTGNRKVLNLGDKKCNMRMGICLCVFEQSR